MLDSTSTFAQNIKQAFSDSCYDLAMRNQKTNAEYRALSKEYRKPFETIRDKLGEDRKLMIKLEELQTHLESIDDDDVYL